MSGTRPYLIAYDIADPRRLVRVARVVSRAALRIQYSVYAARLAPAAMRDLVAELEAIIDPGADDLRIYPLPRRLDAVWYGRSPLPEGVMLAGADWMMQLTGPAATAYGGDGLPAVSDPDEQ